MNDQNQQTHAETKLALLSAWVEYRDRVNELERENAALREQLEQAAIDEGKLRRENTRLLEAILNAPKAVCEELDRRVVRKEAQP